MIPGGPIRVVSSSSTGTVRRWKALLFQSRTMNRNFRTSGSQLPPCRKSMPEFLHALFEHLDVAFPGAGKTRQPGYKRSR